MTRRRLLTLTSVLLIVAVAVAGATGQIAAAFDINRFGIHRYAAYTLLALAAVHVVLAWPDLMAMARHWAQIGRRRRTPPGVPPGVGVPAGRRFALGTAVGFAAGAAAATAFGSFQRRLGVPDELAEAGDLGVLYHRWSRPTYLGSLIKSFAPILEPPLYKNYPEGAVLQLPSAGEAARMPVHQAIRRRRSRRGFSDRPMTLQELADVLYLAVGETDHSDRSRPFRAFPSSGALYPTETYVGVHAVEALAPAIYHYQPQTHALVRVRAGDRSAPLMRAALDQGMVAEAGAVIVLASYFDRAGWKYRDRAYRYALIEAGHIGQNLYLVAEALGLSCCAIGAFFDDDVNTLVGIDGVREAAVYMAVVGHSASAG